MLLFCAALNAQASTEYFIKSYKDKTIRLKLSLIDASAKNGFVHYAGQVEGMPVQLRNVGTVREILRSPDAEEIRSVLNANELAAYANCFVYVWGEYVDGDLNGNYYRLSCDGYWLSELIYLRGKDGKLFWFDADPRGNW